MRLELLPQNVGKACAVKHRALLRLVLFAQSRKEDVFRAVLGIEEVYVESVSMSCHRIPLSACQKREGVGISSLRILQICRHIQMQALQKAGKGWRDDLECHAWCL